MLYISSLSFIGEWNALKRIRSIFSPVGGNKLSKRKMSSLVGNNIRGTCVQLGIDYTHYEFQKKKKKKINDKIIRFSFEKNVHDEIDQDESIQWVIHLVAYKFYFIFIFLFPICLITEDIGTSH